MEAYPTAKRAAVRFERAIASAFTNDALELILLPTEQCNFRCTYCYERFEVGKMAPWLVEGIKRLIERRAESLKSLHLMWFGGEPLVARDVVEELSAFAVAIARNRTGLRYTGSITTNGYRLDVACLSRLVELGIQNYQISLDGPKRFHDTTRVRAGGQGSFDRIWGNLHAIRESAMKVSIVLRLHITPANRAAMPGFVEEASREFLCDPRFSLFFMPIARLGGPRNESIEVIPYAETLTLIAELKEIACRNGGDSRGLEDFFHEELPVCYAARPNSFVVRATGRVAKCTVALEDPNNDLGYLSSDGHLHIDNRKLKPWLRGWQSGSAADLQCPLEEFPLERSHERSAVALPVLR